VEAQKSGINPFFGCFVQQADTADFHEARASKKGILLYRSIDMATENELKELKAQWKADPCWDIEDTEGFEEHAEELKQYRLTTEAEWEDNYKSLVSMKAEKLNCSFETASYFLRLEQRIERLEMLGAK